MNINLLKNKVEYVNYEENGYEETEFNEGSLPISADEKVSIADYSDDETEETIYKKAVRWVLLIGVVLVPLFFLPWTTNVLEVNKQILLAVVAGIGLVLWLLDVVMSGRLSWRYNPLDYGIVAMVGAVALSSAFSVAKFKSVFGMSGSLSDSLLTISSLSVLYMLVANSFNDKGKMVRYVFSGALVVAILYGLLQLFGVHIIKLPFALSRSFNTLGSVNVLGIMAAISLPILYTNKSLNKFMGYLLKLGVLAALAVLVIINWWVLWVVAVAGMVSLVIMKSIALVSHEERFRVSKFLFPLTVIVLGMFLIVINFNLVFIKNNLSIEISPSLGLSLKIARETLKENYVFGYGPENFSLAFDKYGAGELKNSALSGIRFFDATSQVMNTAVHNGLLGLAALGFVFWLLGWSLFKAARLRLINFDSENIGVVSSVIAIVVAMFFYPFNISLALTFYLLLALFTLFIWDKQKMTYNVEDKVSLSLVSSLGFIGGLILSLVGLYFVSLIYVADLRYAKALIQTEPQAAMNHVAKAINWNSNDDRFFRFSSQLALVLLSNELNSQPVKDDNQKNSRIQNYIASSITLAKRATEITPNESNNWANLGNVYQNLIRLVNDADTLAESAYLKASELRPGDPSFHNNIGSMYLIKAELLRQFAASVGGTSAQQFNQQASAALLKAEEAFKKAIELSNNFGLAIYNLGSVYERQGKLNEAIKQIETIAPFNSDKPGLAFELGLLYYRANRKDEAFAQLQKAIVLFPDYANARWFLALIYEERKQLSQAIEQLEKILSVEVNKDNQMITQKLEELKVGKISIPPAKVLDQKPL